MVNEPRPYAVCRVKINLQLGMTETATKKKHSAATVHFRNRQRHTQTRKQAPMQVIK